MGMRYSAVPFCKLSFDVAKHIYTKHATAPNRNRGRRPIVSSFRGEHIIIAAGILWRFHLTLALSCMGMSMDPGRKAGI